MKYLSGFKFCNAFWTGNYFAMRGEYTGDMHKIKFRYLSISEGFFKAGKFFFMSAKPFG